MPTLDWIGKSAVVDHHEKVPTRLLECVPELSAGDPEAGNLLVEGDNLEALKTLLPRYRGQVKCVYTDPPYNTGNARWIYNDSVEDRRVKQWLGDVVGDEASDLCRHDKWLCMMQPRLALLEEFLRPDGAIFVSIDDGEMHRLRGLMDEVFGSHNFMANFIWQKKYSTANDSLGVPAMHDYVVAYARSEAFERGLLPRTQKQDKAYKNPDEDERGPWKAADFTCNKTKGERPNLFYPLKRPADGAEVYPNETRVWAFSREEYESLAADDRLWWGKSGRNSKPSVKRFLSEVKDGLVPNTWLTYDLVGHTDGAKKELLDIVPTVSGYMTPKPTGLIEHILQVVGDPDALVLDSYAGSGTTAHAVMASNERDGGSRRCVLVEMESHIAEDVTRVRWQKVCDGYNTRKGKPVPKLGGGFRYCKLGRTLLDGNGAVNGRVSFADLGRYVYLKATGVPAPKPPRKNCALLGCHASKAVYLLYNGVLGDKRPKGGNVLTRAVLDGLPKHPCGPDNPRLVYGEACRLAAPTLKREGVRFEQIPYEISGR